MAVPKKRRSKRKVNIHRAFSYLGNQKFYKYREFFLRNSYKRNEVRRIPFFEQLA